MARNWDDYYLAKDNKDLVIEKCKSKSFGLNLFKLCGQFTLFATIMSTVLMLIGTILYSIITLKFMDVVIDKPFSLFFTFFTEFIFWIK